MSTTKPLAGSVGGDWRPTDPAHAEWLDVTGSGGAEGGEPPASTRRIVAQAAAGTAVVVQPALTDELVSGDPAALAAMDDAVRAHVLDASTVRVKIWTPDGRIIYCDEPALIGQAFALGEDQRGVFTEPTTRAEVSDLDHPENRFERGQGKLLEVYRPVWTPNGDPVLFETYAPYDDVTTRTGQLWRGFAGITVTSLVTLIALLLPIVWRLLDRVRRSQTQREALLQRAVEASTDERRRIAGTLHDGVVQELAASLRLRDIDVSVDLAAEAETGLDAAAERLIYRVAQECLLNTTKHARARKAWVGLERDEGEIVLDVRDDGVGFDPVGVVENPAGGHFGLRVPGDVAADAGAAVRVASAPGQGTHWQLRVPTT